ncbi:MAG: hypothetical protein GVY16_01890 [Planctomycetes bacterium]|jgi:hypothetical protein|nr:hypothetical protein [Planctomycetota bacterium]
MPSKNTPDQARYEPTVEDNAPSTPVADVDDAWSAEVRDATRDIEDEKQYKGARAFLLLVGLAMILGGVALQRKRIVELTAAKPTDVPPIVDVEPLPFEPPAPEAYPWLATGSGYDPANSIVARIAPPQGYRRLPVPRETFGDWLRYLPIKPGEPPVRLHTGQPRRNQRGHFAVVDLDVGQADRLQSPDVPLRLRAEYLWTTNQGDRIAFELAPGEPAPWHKWANGYRPTFEDAGVAWNKTATPDHSYEAFRGYLDEVFARTDTALLARQMHRIANPANVRIGDVFLHAGKPGHCVIVLDIAESVRTGGRLFLLGQGFLPAQDVHILMNPAHAQFSPWYSLDFGKTLQTPEYRFSETELMRFNG